MEKIHTGQFAQVHYTGKLVDGTVFDSSEGRQPLEFQVGGGQVIPGFDQAVRGMEVNEEKKFTLTSNEAYGPVRDDLKKDFPRDMLGGQEVTEGQELWFKSPQGPVPGKIITLKPDTFTVDFNHPLAGQDLEFSIKLVGISNAPTQVQGCGCSCSSESDSSSCGGGGGCGSSSCGC
jgi:peptidylprolyl isomerase|uniref:Peptidyl-prolyl cis-trans isomerase n=1 Tax=Desulfobacca acetoxidans TaxID=60893 RepID=A0A7V6A2K7_9BACT